jgi:hypothetical protein
MTGLPRHDPNGTLVATESPVSVKFVPIALSIFI